MLEFCRWCPDRDKRNCALPPLSERVILRVRTLGSHVMEGVTQFGALKQGAVIPADTAGAIAVAETAEEAAYIQSVNCAEEMAAQFS